MESSSGGAQQCAWVAALVGLACASAPHPAPDSFLYLHVVPTRVERGFDAAAPLVAVVSASRPTLLAEALPSAAVVSVSGDEVVVRLTPYPAPAVADGASHLAPTFLVDFETEAVRALIAARGATARPTLPELVGWTRDAITPSYDRGFDPASVIAGNRRGDCTEFAVLFAALARDHGYPTRIAVGLVVAEDASGVQVYGHAWTEVSRDGRWQLVDPTPVGGGRVIGYLPVGHLRDEGPGYALDLVRIQSAGVRAVRVSNPR